MAYCITFGMIFLIAGGMFFTGTALRFIEDWQRIPQEEKDQIRIIPLCRNAGVMLALAGIVFIAAGCFPRFRELMFRWTMIGWMALCAADLVYIEKSERYIPGREK